MIARSRGSPTGSVASSTTRPRKSLFVNPRAAAGCAIEAHDYALAKRLATTLPDDDANAAIKRDLLTAAARGQTRMRIYDLSWIVLVLACIALLASAAEAMLRGGLRWPALRPPVEVLFLAPLAIVVAATTYMTQRTIWPAVLRITLVGIALTWLSGVALDLLRARGRSLRARALLHVLACAAGVLAIGYISVMRDGLDRAVRRDVAIRPGTLNSVWCDHVQLALAHARCSFSPPSFVCGGRQVCWS